MVDLAFYYELEAMTVHSPEPDMDTDTSSNYDEDIFELFPTLDTDIRPMYSKPAVPTCMELDTPSNTNADTIARLKIDPLACETINVYEEPDFLGPWPDTPIFTREEPQACIHGLAYALQVKTAIALWCQLPKEAQHYLVKVATDYQLHEHKDTALSAAETRKAVFWKAMDDLALDSDIAQSLATRYSVHRRRVLASESIYIPNRDESTLTDSTDSFLANIVREARDYLVKIDRSFLLPVITQSAYHIQRNLLETSYFGFPEVQDKWLPSGGSKAANQAFAAFRVRAGGKGKPNERLLFRYIDLPRGSFMYGMTGIKHLEEAGRYTFIYPEAYTRLFEKKDGDEILLCTAASLTATAEDTEPVITLTEEEKHSQTDAVVNPSDTITQASTLVNSVFHKSWAAGGKAPVGPQRYETNSSLEQVGKIFHGFPGFIQFYLPKGFYVTGPSGRSVTFDRPFGKAASSDAGPVAHGAGGWYTIITHGLQRGAFNAQHQLDFREDFILRMKLSQPAAIFRDLQLMPRVTEPGVHEVIVGEGQDVDMKCENGRYYMARGMEPPAITETALSIEMHGAEYDVPAKAPVEAKPSHLTEDRFQQMVRDISSATIEALRKTDMPGLEATVIETATATTVTRSGATDEAPSDKLPMDAAGSLTSSRASTPKSSITRTVFVRQDGRSLKRKMILSEAQETLAPYREWLVSEDQREIRQEELDFRAHQEQQLAMEEASRASKPKPKRTQAPASDDEEWVEPKKTAAVRPKKKAKANAPTIKKENTKPAVTLAQKKKTEAIAPINRASKAGAQPQKCKKSRAAWGNKPVQQQKKVAAPRSTPAVVKIKSENNPPSRKRQLSVDIEDEKRDAKRSKKQVHIQTQKKQVQAPVKLEMEQPLLNRKRQRPNEANDDDDDGRSRKKQATRKPSIASEGSKTSSQQNKVKQNNQRKQSGQTSPKHVSHSDSSEDDYSSGHDSDASVASRRAQDATTQGQMPVENVPGIVPAGIDPVTGKQLFTMHIPSEVAAAMARLPSGARIHGLPPAVLPQTNTSPAQHPMPFMPALAPQNPTASFTPQALQPWQYNLMHTFVMNNLAASMGANPAMAQGVAASIFQHAAPPGSQLPTPTTPAFPPESVPMQSGSDQPTGLQTPPQSQGSRVPEYIEIIDEPASDD
ncbi:uncharacterized protein B0I36DRAFT_362985 [Microdochium trichocladiopsis]|uniref:Uncharacterized protein n=1 Tax=Microdochium trichocladiopsis TaxID=1682393 RepID=A0A9P8Y6L0_9PEZI|nr:uncharacterized protein B0I36DRAFT_362985 [Microdochium trichocladiopsis]KAH7031271.1 hypothetical protein B0I36DRAFT_362985 [Microdochium trichocladiopsis]